MAIVDTNDRLSSSTSPSGQFDVNSFLHKTLSNYNVSQTEHSNLRRQPVDDDDIMDGVQQTSTANTPLLQDDALPGYHQAVLSSKMVPPPCNVPVRHHPSAFAPVTQHHQSRQPAPALRPLTQPLPPKAKLGVMRCGSRTSLDSSRTLCRICHLPSESPSDVLIAPCRCSGTMKHVHTACLVHWLEISSKKMCPSPQCELCGYFYKTHHCFRWQRLHTPHCSAADRVLHVVFLLVFIVMLGCATLSILYLRGDPSGTASLRSSLNSDDVIVIVCSILFFCSFFIAVFTQYRAEASLCRIVFMCCAINRNWRIKNYDPKDDAEYWMMRQSQQEHMKQQQQQHLMYTQHQHHHHHPVKLVPPQRIVDVHNYGP